MCNFHKNYKWVFLICSTLFSVLGADEPKDNTSSSNEQTNENEKGKDKESEKNSNCPWENVYHFDAVQGMERYLYH